MASNLKVVARMNGRVNELCRTFPHCLNVFENNELFIGPSWYFHQKTLARGRTHATVSTLLEDDTFFDLLYATLTSWGLHRMGPGNTKLRDIDDLRRSCRSQAESIALLAGAKLGGIPPNEVPKLIQSLWAVIATLQVSVAEARIVANSKTLHHILPELVPPIDREYTFNFFYNRTNLSIPEEEAFTEIFMQLDHIARFNHSEISRRVGKRWHTSYAKVVDNAIIGFVMQARSREALGQAAVVL